MFLRNPLVHLCKPDPNPPPNSLQPGASGDLGLQDAEVGEQEVKLSIRDRCWLVSRQRLAS